MIDGTSRITLRDSTQVRVRPIGPDDEPRLVDLYERLSPDTHFLANVDYERRFALVVEQPGERSSPSVAMSRRATMPASPSSPSSSRTAGRARASAAR